MLPSGAVTFSGKVLDIVDSSENVVLCDDVVLCVDVVLCNDVELCEDVGSPEMFSAGELISLQAVKLAAAASTDIIDMIFFIGVLLIFRRIGIKVSPGLQALR